jgi:hypothetical protein
MDQNLNVMHTCLSIWDGSRSERLRNLVQQHMPPDSFSMALLEIWIGDIAIGAMDEVVPGGRKAGGGRFGESHRMGICPSLPLQLQCRYAEIRGKVDIIET